MRKTQLFVLLLILVTVAFSCDRSRFYDHTVNVPGDGWHKDSTAVFNVEISDTIGLYKFYINLRNNNDYLYSNFYLFLNSTLPNGELARDTIELTLADRSGKWLGKGFGRLKDNQVEVRYGLRFPLRGNYLFEIEQAMRDTVLVGIENIGIRIERRD